MSCRLHRHAEVIFCQENNPVQRFHWDCMRSCEICAIGLGAAHKELMNSIRMNSSFCILS